MAAKTRGLLAQQEHLLSRFKGALVGAVVGDCLGAHFEFSMVPPENLVKQVVSFFQRLPSLNVNATDSDSDTEAEPANGEVPTRGKEGATTSKSPQKGKNVSPKGTTMCLCGFLVDGYVVGETCGCFREAGECCGSGR